MGKMWLAMAAALAGTAVMASRSWGAGSFSGELECLRLSLRAGSKAEGRFVAERLLHGAPRRALLLAIAATQPIGIQMRLAGICLVPRHANSEPTDEELSEVYVLPFRAQQQIEVDEAGIA